MSRAATRALALIAVLAAGALLAACGSSESKGNGTSSSATQTSASNNDPKAIRTALVACLRSHGIALQESSDGTITPEASVNAQQLASAMATCRHSAIPAGGSGNAASHSAAATALKSCVDEHGGSAGGEQLRKAIHECLHDKHITLPALGIAGVGKQIEVHGVTIDKKKLAEIKIGKIKIGKLDLKKIKIGPLHIKSLEKLGTAHSLGQSNGTQG